MHERITQQLAELKAEHDAIWTFIRATDQWQRLIGVDTAIAVLEKVLADTPQKEGVKTE